MKISIIMPVYNVATFVADSIDSVIRQTLREWELIAVDDGSTDGSGEILDRIAQEDSRIHVIHQRNQGVSAARNVCLQHAKGEFIAPIDSDDLVATDYLEKLYAACIELHAEISICDFRTLLEKEKRLEIPNNIERKNVKRNILSSEACLVQMYHPESSGMNFTPWGKLYRRELFMEEHLRYPKGKIHEDQAVTYRLIDRAKHIAVVSEELYYYRTREGSIMHQAFGWGRLDLADATRGQCDYFLAKNETKIASLAINNHFRTLFSLLAGVRKSESEDCSKIEVKIKTMLKEDAKKYLPEANFSWARKSVYYVSSQFPGKVIIEVLRMF